MPKITHDQIKNVMYVIKFESISTVQVDIINAVACVYTGELGGSYWGGWKWQGEYTIIKTI